MENILVMESEDRESFLRDLAEKVQEVNVLFDDHGIDSPNIDCEIDEDCNLPDDHDIITIRNLFVEANQILENYMN